MMETPLVSSQHIPVLLDEVVSSLNAKVGGTFLDCTLGGGGHAEAILQANSTNVLYGVDRDSRALERVRLRLDGYKPRFNCFHNRFSAISSLLSSHSVEGRLDVRFDGILADLGVSTDQLKEGRGFSFRDSGRLDMRMDESASWSAMEVVNESDLRSLIKILKEGGVGQEANLVAREIISCRPISDTDSLAKLVAKVIPQRLLNPAKKSHPATVVFQALRIAVNAEFAEIQSLMNVIPSLVNSGSTCVIISFHSGEDTIVARAMRQWSAGNTRPPSLPGPRDPNERILGTLLTKKPILPSPSECNENPASRSARMRVFKFR
jgi:16S rRNA (cytosine1402-N4)-methyltransferase